MSKGLSSCKASAVSSRARASSGWVRAISCMCWDVNRGSADLGASGLRSAVQLQRKTAISKVFREKIVLFMFWDGRYGKGFDSFGFLLSEPKEGAAFFVQM